MGLLRSFVDILSLCAFVSAAPITTSVSPTVTSTAAATTTTVEPCALAASASSAYLSANTDAAHARIPADVAYNCLRTLPNYKEAALELLDSLHPYIEWQSTLSYLKDPPIGYLFPGVDIEAGLDAIVNNVGSDAYASEYDFQMDLFALFAAAKDGHFGYRGDALDIFTFLRPIDLVSVSLDGVQLPQVFVTGDLVDTTDGVYTQLNVTYAASAVIAIDGVDVVTFLQATSFVSNSQDPDACYNQAFSQLAQQAKSGGSTFSQPTVYPGPSTTLTFANGTSRTFANTAYVKADLSNVTNGDDVYSSNCIPSSTQSSTAPSSTSSSSSASVTATDPGYPYPAAMDSSNSVGGYFLNQTGSEDVAVLVISTFDPPTGKTGYGGFQEAIQDFLAEAVQEGKTHLIIDLQRNPGGVVDLGIDLFAQLFPSIAPVTQGAYRATVAFEAIARWASEELESQMSTDSDVTTSELPPFTFQTELRPNGSSFESWEQLVGPIELYGDKFTSLLQNNNSESERLLSTEGFVQTGTGNRTGFRQPFAAENIILLYDGACASTCTIFSEMMKNLAGVQSIAVGGRPQNAPMQGVGGVKGSNIFPFSSINTFMSFVIDDPTAEEDFEGTVFENNTDYAITRAMPGSGGVNSKNNYRLGDSSLTPLHFVYEASDCRMWWTKEMLTDMTFLWNRVAATAFGRRTSFADAEYCIRGSTGHPTSLSGGLKQGTLGPQQPPAGAMSTVNGWFVPLENGTSVIGTPGAISVAKGLGDANGADASTRSPSPSVKSGSVRQRTISVGVLLAMAAAGLMVVF